MIVAILRSVVSLTVSLVVALALIVGTEGVSAIFHPFPPGVDSSDIEVCKAHVARYPQWLLAVAAGMWAGTSLVSSWLATRLGAGRHPAHGIVIGVLLVTAAGCNMFLLPYPVWFEAANWVLLPVGALAGIWLGRGGQRRPAGAATESLRDDASG